jgi:hypothetical protein
MSSYTTEGLTAYLQHLFVPQGDDKIKLEKIKSNEKWNKLWLSNCMDLNEENRNKLEKKNGFLFLKICNPQISNDILKNAFFESLRQFEF